MKAIYCPILLMLMVLVGCKTQEPQGNAEPQPATDETPLLELPVARVYPDTFPYFEIADTQLARYALPAHIQKKPKAWMEADKAMADRYSDTRYPYMDTLNLQRALALIDTARFYSDLWQAREWCQHHPQESFPQLVARLSHKRKVGLEGTADLIIGCRMGTGELTFYGHGGIENEDLFTPAGRASWVLNSITGEEFAVVDCDLTPTQAQYFKDLWVDYIRKLR